MAKKTQTEIEKEILAEAMAEAKEEKKEEKKPKKKEEPKKEPKTESKEEQKQEAEEERKVAIGKKKKTGLMEKAQETIKELKDVKKEGKKPAKPTLERVYTIKLTQRGALTSRTKKSMHHLRAYVKKHTKADEVSIGQDVNEYIWARSYKKPPAKIRVKVERDEEGRALVSLQK